MNRKDRDVSIPVPVHWTKLKAQYDCSHCENKYKRAIKSSWSETSSLNWEGRERELDEKEHEECVKRSKTMECPKCDTVNQPQSVVHETYVQR